MTEKRWGALFVIFIALVCMLPFIYKSLWPTTDAIVINSGVDNKIGMMGGFNIQQYSTPFGVDVTFKYSVDNVGYVYEQKGPYFGYGHEVEKVLKKYPIGHSFRAHYNPINHSEASLPIEINYIMIIIVPICFVFIILGIRDLIQKE